jgi:RNA polymerase sigma factor (sigma-70 family)
MDEEAPSPPSGQLDLDVTRAKAGDRGALDSVLRSVQRDVHGLALRFLWHPQDAEDATQEILIRVVTALSSFRGESSFRTWVYRIACNALLTLRKKRMELQAVNLEEFGEDLARGLSDSWFHTECDVEETLLLEEVKVRCTHAMLMCLDRNHRLAYILGEILELDHREAAEVLAVSPTAFRKRLSRARASITSFMRGHCGLVDPVNACRCRRRVAAAIDLGHVDPGKLLFAQSPDHARQFSRVVGKIRQLEETQRAAALYKSHQIPEPTDSFVAWLRRVLDKELDARVDGAV